MIVSTPNYQATSGWDWSPLPVLEPWIYSFLVYRDIITMLNNILLAIDFDLSLDHLK